MAANQAFWCPLHKASQLLLLLVLIFAPIEHSVSLRTGAPGLACLNLRPFHGLHRARPGSSSQFFLTQSSLSYGPHQNISVDIVTLSSERYFRGFMVQAYDPLTGYQLGRFQPTSESKPLDCSASTHRNNLNKKHVTLIWVPGTYANPADERSNNALNLADQWLGTHTSRSNQPTTAPPSTNNAPVIGASLATSVPATTNRKRQLTPFSVGLNNHSQRRPVAVNGPRQVRFKATIVVTYDEFYNNFESSEQKLDKIEYAGTMGFPNNNLTIPSTITIS